MTALLIIASVVLGAYWSFCWGADWARRGAEKRANADLAAAVRRHDAAAQALADYDLEHAYRGDLDPRRRALALASRQAWDVRTGAKAASNQAFYEATNWAPLCPFLPDLTWRERLDDLREWLRRKPPERRGSTVEMTADDRRMLADIKREVLGRRD